MTHDSLAAHIAGLFTKTPDPYYSHKKYDKYVWLHSRHQVEMFWDEFQVPRNKSLNKGGEFIAAERLTEQSQLLACKVASQRCLWPQERSAQIVLL